MGAGNARTARRPGHTGATGDRGTRPPGGRCPHGRTPLARLNRPPNRRALLLPCPMIDLLPHPTEPLPSDLGHFHAGRCGQLKAPVAGEAQRVGGENVELQGADRGIGASREE